VLCVYQLRDPNTFNQIAGEDEGLSKLLEGSRFDSSVTSSKKFVIHPDTEISETLDRAEGAKYVCIVAGYYELEKDQILRRIPIPLSIFTKQPKKLNIDLILGSQEIQGLRVK
jgi:predicted component of type VI protein secretion system